MPVLTKEARARANQLTNDFGTSLKAIADQLATANGSEAVTIPHVENAHLALKQNGLVRPARKRFWERHDFKVAGGTFVAAQGPTIASFARDVLESAGPLKDQPVAMWGWMIALPFLVTLSGLGLAIWGWVESPENPR